MIGKEIAHYQIEARLGAGGMGEVFQARDTRLGRNVAVKVLPEMFVRDADRVARFEREAKLLASLNHANIAALYGLEESDGRHFLVMELVEGETLAERIRRGAIPADEAFDIAHQITEALEAAHEKGIIHRDLKPANVKITPEAKVKVLDFGLAKALENAPAQLASNSPTLLSAAATNAGMILGTAGYMSPEQARGHEADQRSDVFSFGSVLYEMLTGREAFPGDTVTDVIASVVAREPDFAAIPANLNPKAPEIIRRCLAKNRKDRWHAIADVRVEIETILHDPHGLKLQVVKEIPKRPLWRRAVPFVVTAILVAAIAVATTVMVTNTRPTSTARITRFPFVLPQGQTFSNNGRNMIDISPDGEDIVYVANGQLYLRSMNDMESRPIQGSSQNASMPFFSPDGRWVGFVSRSDQKLKKIAVTGGAAVTICDLVDTASFGAHWSPDDQIFIGQTRGIIRVSANGGKPEKIVTLNEGETAHRPQLLPGSDALLFTLATDAATDRWDKAQIVVQFLNSAERKVLIPGGTDARYVPTGHIVYALGTTLLAVGFNQNELRVAGGAVPILEDVRRAAGQGGDANFGFSTDGSMAYIPRGAGSLSGSSLVLIDRSGVRTPLNIPAAPYRQPRISPDGKQLAVETDDGRDRIVWIYELAGIAPLRRLTFGGLNSRPTWTRDGQRIVFFSQREGDRGLYWQRADGNGQAEKLITTEQDLFFQPESWTPDGKTLIFDVRREVELGISMLTLGANQKPAPVIGAPAGNSSLSHDGKWLAYPSIESGRPEVYVQPFPTTGAKYQITTTGGSNPLWSPDGKQLFYLTPGPTLTRQIVSVDIETQPVFRVVKTTPLPIELFQPGPRNYDITPDGKHFIATVSPSQADPGKTPPEQIFVTLNWFEELKQRVPAGTN